MEKQSFEEVSPIKKCRWFYQLAIFVFETSSLSSATEVMRSRTKDHLYTMYPPKKDERMSPEKRDHLFKGRFIFQPSSCRKSSFVFRGGSPSPCRYPSIIQPCRWCRVLRHWIPYRFTKHVEILIYWYNRVQEKTQLMGVDNTRELTSTFDLVFRFFNTSPETKK